MNDLFMVSESKARLLAELASYESKPFRRMPLFSFGIRDRIYRHCYSFAT